MRVALKSAPAFAALALLAGCASTPDNPPYGSRPAAAGLDSYDQAYMARVEAAAARRGVDVRWVHPPRRPQR